VFQLASAQKLKKADKQIVQYLQQQVGYLSSDELKGRRAGDPGEILASEFIASKFKEIGLSPKGDNATFFQHFTINDGKEISKDNELKLNGKLLKVGVDFFPLSNSPSASFNAESSPSLNEKGQPWMVDLAESIEENKENPHFDVANLLNEKMLKAKEKGASAVIFYNSSSLDDKIKFDPKDRSEPAPLPAAYITNNTQKQYLSDVSSSFQISANFSISPKIRKARNVIGFLDNNAPYTIVIGAHFDHLGYGEDGNSMIRSGELGIHNGADDNASGTSSMIELAFLLKNSKSKQFNYLFIAFSAEELGLNGSKYFVENPTISLNSINYMINMDMVGRMNDSTKTITVGGYGTSPSWKAMMDAVKKKDFSIKIDSSGTGPSDHTSFYRKDIPVLFFFTGLHSDYHKPTDDADKINYVGMLKIIRFIQQMIEADKQDQKLVFTKTREQQTSTSTRFSVSMGIMPDYSYTGAGVRVDGVSDNRPAKKAGILAGDIVKQLGEHKTSSVESYMQALSKFKKGDKTTTVVLRGDKEFSFEIVF
jgi:Zn-dependent M28 family amino/carboxypeptidase